MGDQGEGASADQGTLRVQQDAEEHAEFQGQAGEAEEEAGELAADQACPGVGDQEARPDYPRSGGGTTSCREGVRGGDLAARHPWYAASGNDELALLYEKVKIQQSTLQTGEVAYKERLEEIRALKIQIANLNREMEIQ